MGARSRAVTFRRSAIPTRVAFAMANLDVECQSRPGTRDVGHVDLKSILPLSELRQHSNPQV
jgi:hypothetical protein